MPPTLVYGDGPLPCDIMIVGERPGIEELRAAQRDHTQCCFIGPAGQELWNWLWKSARIDRDGTECGLRIYVTNLVKTFSMEPPTPVEIARDAMRLRLEIRRAQPRLIIAAGAYAARHFLPQFADVVQEVWHGLAYEVRIGRDSTRTTLVLPIVHPSAALRQPDRYQNLLAADCVAVRRVWTLLAGGRDPIHRTTHLRNRVYRIGLAEFGREGRTLGLDTEGTVATPECVAIAHEPRHACVVEVDERGSISKFLRPAIQHASRIFIHAALGDSRLLERLGIDLTLTTVDDTMIMAALLGLPQGLKTLAYREFGFQMQAYEDLVGPIDTTLVQEVLQHAYTKGLARKTEADRLVAEIKARVKAAKQKAAQDTRREAHYRNVLTRSAFARWQSRRGDRAADRGDGGSGAGAGQPRSDTQHGGQHPVGQQGSGDGIGSGQGAEEIALPPRALTSLRRILTTPGQDSLRSRWSKSAFAATVPLPPPATWRSAPPTDRIGYVMADAVAHLVTGTELRKRIRREGLLRTYLIDRNTLPFLARTETVGMAVNRDELHRLSAAFAADFATIGAQIDALAGYPVNPCSGDQVSDCLFQNLGIDPTRRTKGGSHYTTADKYLKARKLQHTIIPLILEARQINKYLGTYTKKLPGMLQQDDAGLWRYHPDWRYTRTKTGRLAEEIILLIPKHSARAKQIRNCFYAGAGRTLVSVDLSQIELRVMAHLSQDPHLLKAYRNGVDIHAQVAHEVLGAPAGKDHQDESLHRLPAKTFNFAIINGSTEYGILDQLHEAGQLHWTLDAVADVLKEWFKVHAGVKRYWDNAIAHGRRYGYVVDLFGRRSYLAGLRSSDERIRIRFEREALFAIQASADSISKIWNAAIWREMIVIAHKVNKLYCEPWVRVHDDTILEVDSRMAETVRDHMLRLVPQVLCVPTTAEGKMGETWGNLH